MREYPDGYIAKLAELMDAEVGEALRREILAGAEAITPKTRPAERAAKMKMLMERMEARIDPATAVRIRFGCSCKPQSYLKRARSLLKQSADLTSFLTAVQEYRFLGNPIRLEGQRIVADFGFCACVCGKVRATQERMPMLWCECCRGHVAWMYASLLERPVAVTFTETVVTGGEECRYIVDLS